MKLDQAPQVGVNFNPMNHIAYKTPVIQVRPISIKTLS
jgi:hypothetical protein